MTTNYPKGAIIVKGDEKRKILEELGDLRFLSLLKGSEAHWEDTPISTYNPYSIQELERNGWKVEGEKWKPKDGETFWIVVFDDKGMAKTNTCSYHYLTDELEARLENKNFFRTQAEAQVIADKINKLFEV